MNIILTYFDDHRRKISIHFLLDIGRSVIQHTMRHWSWLANKRDRHAIEPNPVLIKKSPFVNAPQRKRPMKSSSKIPSPLAVEELEDRQMLSTVSIFAAGDTGTETIQLNINDAVVATFENVGGDADTRQFQRLTYTTDQQISASDVRVQFSNDLFRSEDGFDRNVVIDRIEVDGRSFETESPTTFHTGIYGDGGLTGPGFLETEQLNINGLVAYFDSGDPNQNDRSQIVINARGSVGGETFNLRIDDEVVASFEAGTNFEAFEFSVDRPIGPENVSVEFTNDLFTEEFDRNLIVDNISINGETFESEGSEVFSTGTWLQGSIEPGFGRGEVLHTNGFFRYGVSGPSTDDLTIVARGDEGNERFRVLVNSEVVAELQINGTGENTFVVENAGVTDPSQVRIEFFDDLYDPTAGINNNLDVDYIQFGDQRIDTDASDVFTDGTWVVGRGPTSGFGIGGRLDVNGSIQFGVGGGSDLALATEFSVAQPISGFGEASNRAFASRPDGQTLVGILQNPQASNLTSVVQLVGIDGNVDTSFGQTSGISGEIIEIAVSDDNSFYVRTDTAITRFSATGERLFDFPLTEVFSARTMATDSDGNLILAEYDNGIVVSRILASGGLDESFQGGSVTIFFDRFDFTSGVTDVETLSNGQIAISVRQGTSRVSAESAIVLVDENGNLVTSFGDGGIASVDGTTLPLSLTSDSEGRIYASDLLNVYRLTANGQLDESWSDNGRLFLFDRLVDLNVLVDNQDRVLVVAEVNNFTALETIGSREDAILVRRFNQDGTPDVEFGDGGQQVGEVLFSSSADIDPSGNLLISGFRDGDSISPLDRVRFYRRFLLS